MNENFKDYVKYATANVLGMIGLSCYILADTFFVSKAMGSQGLAALNIAIPVYNFFHGCGLMLGMGGATRYAILKAGGFQKEQNQIFTNTVISAAFISVLFFLIGIFLSAPLVRLLGANEAVFSMCRTYLKILLMFSPIFILNDIVICFVRNDGGPQLAMTAMLTGSFSNIILDYILIFVFDMGIKGAAIATGFSPLISLMVMSVFFIKRKNCFHFRYKKPYIRIVGRIISTGVSSLASELSSGIIMIVYNLIIIELEGNTGVAAYGIAANLSLVVTAVYTGIAQGIQPVISRNTGEGYHSASVSVLKYAAVTVCLVSCVVYSGILFGSDFIAGVFNSVKDHELQSMAQLVMKLYFTGCLFAGINIVSAAFFSASGKPAAANIISLLRGFVLIIPGAFVMSAIWGLKGLCLSFAAAELLTFLLSLCFNAKKSRY